MTRLPIGQSAENGLYYAMTEFFFGTPGPEMATATMIPRLLFDRKHEVVKY